MPYCPHGKHKGGEGRRGERSAGRPEVVRPRGKGKPLASAHEVRQGRMRGVQVRQGASHVDIRVPRRGQAQVLYRFRKTRAGSVPAGVFGGRRPHGVLVTDRYTGYDRPWRGDRQYCYAHILRKLLRLLKKEPDNKEYRAFVPPMAEQLRAAMKLRSRGLPPWDFAREAEAVRSRIVELANRSAKDPALQNVQNIFREHADRMYHWARGPDIPAENNRAERGVRGLVIARKTSFGGQSEGALRVREVNQSVMETLALRHDDPAAKLAQALDVYASTGKKSAVRDFLFPRAGRLDCAQRQAQR